MTKLGAMLWVLGLLAAGPSRAAEGAWEVVATGKIRVKARQLPGSPVKEIWAEGVIDAPVQDVQSALMDPEKFPGFMPYVKESRYVGKPQPDGSRFVYTRLDLPIVTSRDYVIKVTLEKGVAEDGSGDFKNRWVAVNDMLPARANIVRLTHNEGSWHVRPHPGGKSYAVYRFSVDPGGWIPAFAADMGNRTAVTDTFKAVEKEAQRRAAERKAKTAKR